MRTDLGKRLAWLGPVLALAACDGAGTADAGDDGSGGGGGSSVGLCPDPANPRVHYESADPNACMDVELPCTTDQNGFDNACGCGCIDKGDPICPNVDDPDVSWISQDPAECPAEAPKCDGGRVGFSSSCGCGCLLSGS